DPGAGARYPHYRKLRKQMPPATLAFTLVELCARLPAVRAAATAPEQVVRRVAELVRAFPEPLRAQLVARDLAYVEMPVAYLESWWADLSKHLPAEPPGALERIRSSRFFSVTHDEGALARFELEAQLLALVWEGIDVDPVCARVRALARTSTALVEELSLRRLDGEPPEKAQRRAG